MTKLRYEQTTDDLHAIRCKLAAPTCWTKNEFAKTSGGLSTQPRSPAAVCWCLTGAAIAVCGPDTKRYDDIILALARGIGVLPEDDLEAQVQIWNDSDMTGHEDVIDLLDREIAYRRRRRVLR